MTTRPPTIRAFLGDEAVADNFAGGGGASVTIDGEQYVIVDIGMRMLTPRELFRAQGFDDAYRIDPEYNGKPLTKTAQIRMCGNSVCPPIAEAIVRALFAVDDEPPAARAEAA